MKKLKTRILFFVIILILLELALFILSSGKNWGTGVAFYYALWILTFIPAVCLIVTVSANDTLTKKTFFYFGILWLLFLYFSTPVYKSANMVAIDRFLEDKRNLEKDISNYYAKNDKYPSSLDELPNVEKYIFEPYYRAGNGQNFLII